MKLPSHAQNVARVPDPHDLEKERDPKDDRAMNNIHHPLCGVIPPHILSRVAETAGAGKDL